VSSSYLHGFIYRLFQKIFKQGAVTDHRFAKILSGALASSVANRDFMRRAIVLDHTRMIHRKVGGILLKIADWITPPLHDVLDQDIGVLYRSSRIVHEQRLLRAPVFGIFGAFFVPQRMYVEFSYAFLAFFKIGLRVGAIAMSIDGFIVFGPKLGAQILRPPLLYVHPHGRPNRENGEDDKDHHGRSEIALTHVPVPPIAQSLGEAI
jgi:hypothetical protein